jgi:outer membrane receptor for ferrienterochelin and colicins
MASTGVSGHLMWERACPRLLLACAISAMLATGTTLAQTTPTPTPTKPADPPAPQVVDKVEITGTQSYDERREDTATKIVVTSEEITKFGDTQILDVMKRLPGVTVQNNAIRMRGLGNGYTQILIDGERPPPGFSIDNLSPELVERIEIIRAATAEYSTQAVAGTVNIVMKKKFSVSKREVNAGWYSGTGYTSQNLSFNIADKAGTLAYSLGGYSGLGTFGYDGTGTTVGVDSTGKTILDRTSRSANDGNNRWAGLYSTLAWTLPGGDSFTMNPTLNLYRYASKNHSITQYLLGETTIYPISDGHNEGDGWNVGNSANWIIKMKEGAKLDLKVNLNVGGRNNDAYSKSFDFDQTQTLERSTLAPSRDRRASFVGKYSTPIVEGHSLLAGWDVGVNRSTSSNRVVETNVAAPPIDTLEDYTANVRKFAFFAQDEWNVTPNWSVYAGFRWEGIETTTSGDGITTTTNRSSVASPLFQTLWKFPDKSGRQFRLALTRTYKAPETNSLVPRISRSTVNTSTTPDYQMGNPALKPELATGVDVAYEHFFAKGASMSLSGSVRALTDYNTRGIFLVDGRWINQPFNNGNATTKSIEFDAKFPLQTLYPAAPPIDFRFNVARNFSHVDEVPGPNNRLDQQVPVSGTLGLDYRMRGGMVTAGASYSFKSGGDVRLTTNQINYATPKRELEMYVLYKYTPKLQFRARLANVLRQDTLTSTNYFDETGSTKTVSVRPTQMNIGASVKLDF